MNVANIDLLVGCAVLDPAWRALVVAVLSLVMAEIGKADAVRRLSRKVIAMGGAP